MPITSNKSKTSPVNEAVVESAGPDDVVSCSSIVVVAVVAAVSPVATVVAGITVVCDVASVFEAVVSIAVIPVKYNACEVTSNAVLESISKQNQTLKQTDRQRPKLPENERLTRKRKKLRIALLQKYCLPTKSIDNADSKLNSFRIGDFRVNRSIYLLLLICCAIIVVSVPRILDEGVVVMAALAVVMMVLEGEVLNAGQRACAVTALVVAMEDFVWKELVSEVVAVTRSFFS